jgi:phosphoribosyl-ATP pyrophosphohydrolase
MGQAALAQGPIRLEFAEGLVYGRGMSSEVLERLMQVIESRKAATAERSYTSSLLAGGVAKIGAKITEEAAEVVEAAGESGAEAHAHLVHEAADLLYHLLVMLACRDVTLAEVEAELARRFGTSGHVEKAARGDRS